jgi:hypothetical protein
MTILASASERKMSVEQFVAKSGVEALDEAVLPLAAPFNERVWPA